MIIILYIIKHIKSDYYYFSLLFIIIKSYVLIFCGMLNVGQKFGLKNNNNDNDCRDDSLALALISHPLFSSFFLLLIHYIAFFLGLHYPHKQSLSELRQTQLITFITVLVYDIRALLTFHYQIPRAITIIMKAGAKEKAIEKGN